jgi:hypothetical protein
VSRRGLIALLFALTACGVPDRENAPAGRSDTRQVPSNYAPGLHIGGHVDVGVVRRF